MIHTGPNRGHSKCSVPATVTTVGSAGRSNSPSIPSVKSADLPGAPARSLLLPQSLVLTLSCCLAEMEWAIHAHKPLR